MAHGFLEGYLEMNQDIRAREALNLHKDDAKMRQKLNEAILLEHEAELQEMERKKKEREARKAAALQIPSGLPMDRQMDTLADMLFRSGDYEEGLKLSEQASLAADREFKRKTEKREEFNKRLSELSNAFAGVDSQEAADEVWATIDADPAYKGIVPKWVPRVYTPQTAPAFDRFGKITTSALQRETLLKADAQIKRQEEMTAAANRRLELQEQALEQERIESRRREARSQASLHMQDARFERDAANQLRDEQNAALKPYNTIQQQVTKVKQLLTDGSPAADEQINGLLVDLFDPTRATNLLFQKNRNFGSLAGRAAGFIGRLYTGQYTQAQKKEIRQMIEAMEDQVLTPTRNRVIGEYRKTAKELGVRPSLLVTPDFSVEGSTAPETAPEPKQTTVEGPKAPAGTRKRFPDGTIATSNGDGTWRIDQ